MELKPIVERVAQSENKVHDHPLIDRVYRNRGIKDAEEVNYSLKKLIHPFKMKGIEEAAELLIKHIMAGSKIVVIGDYDCDGATSTTIAVQGLQMMGAKDVKFAVPDRLTQGYGLSPDVVKGIAHLEPDLIVTVDNGIASLDGVKAAKDLGCEVLVTDHHLPAESGVLPPADVIVNPQQPGCNFPSKAIAGCGVIFYVIAGLRIKMKEQGVFNILGIDEKKTDLTPLLDVLGLGTIADVVPMDDENNRHMVNASIKMIRNGQARPLFYQLLSLAGKDYKKLVSSDFGFKIGPRVNAAGRLESMDLAIRGFLSTNEHETWKIAQELEGINKIRKEMSSNHEEEAAEIMQTEAINSEMSGVCVYSPDWHEGVVGILAGRVKEKLNRPAIAMTMTHETAMVLEAGRYVYAGRYEEAESLLMDKKEKLEEVIRKSDLRDVKNADDISERDYAQHSPEYVSILKMIEKVRERMPSDRFAKMTEAHVHKYGEIKGSCRSVPGVHLKHVLDYINKSHPEVLGKFGGHAMAAGVTINLSQLDAFRKYFDAECEKYLTAEVKDGKLEVDMVNPDPSYFTLDTAEAIAAAGPWGQLFAEPLFKSDFEVVQARVVGSKHLKLKVRVPGDNRAVDAIVFNCVENGQLPTRIGNTVELVYKLEVNEFRGERNLQLLVDLLQDPKMVMEFNELQKFQDDENTKGSLSGVIDDQKTKNVQFRESKLAVEPTM